MDGKRHRARKSVVGSTAVGLLATVLAGCDCEKERKVMELMAEKGFEDSAMCCEAIVPLNPEAAKQCYLGLKEWRQQITSLIIQWYQACLNGNQNLASQLLQAAKALFVQGFTDDCPPVQLDPTGRIRTAGLPFSHADVLTLRGQFEGPFKLVVAEGRETGSGDGTTTPLILTGGRFSGTIFGTHVNGGLTGDLTLGEARLDGSMPVMAFVLDFKVPGGAIHCTLSDDGRWSAFKPTATGGLLGVKVALAVGDDVPYLMPNEAWLELPLHSTPHGFAFAGGNHSMRALLPPTFGWADWNQDGTVNHDDWTDYFTAPPESRDLDLDGDADDADDVLFIRSFRLATGK